MKILMVVLMFFMIGALMIVSNNNLAMQNPENLNKFSDIFLKWLDQIFSNSQKITGEVIKLDWMPQN